MSVPKNAQCSWAGCKFSSDSALRGRPLCGDHFYQSAMQLLGDYRRDLPILAEKDKLEIPGFLGEIITQASLLAAKVKLMSSEQRERLLQLSFAAMDFYKRVQRSPRVAREIEVELSGGSGTGQKSERTRTIDVSRKGASVHTRFAWKVGEELRITILPTMSSARARVAWCSHSQNQEARVGLEILDADDFWGLW